MTPESLFSISPILGIVAGLSIWFYRELRIRDQTLATIQQENHKELMEMQKQNLLSQHEMTATVSNNTIVMHRILSVVERLEDKK